MAGRGPAPKLGAKLGHSTREVVDIGDGQAKSWPIPSPPGDEPWRPEAIEWWTLAMASPSAAAWVEADRVKLQRAMWMVDRWWRFTVENPAEAMRQADAIRRAETELYLSPAERARAGLKAEQAAPAAGVSTSTISDIRERLRASDAVGE